MAMTRVTNDGKTVATSYLTPESYVVFERSIDERYWDEVYLEVTNGDETVGTYLPAWVIDVAAKVKPWDNDLRVSM